MKNKTEPSKKSSEKSGKNLNKSLFYDYNLLKLSSSNVFSKNVTVLVKYNKDIPGISTFYFPNIPLKPICHIVKNGFKLIIVHLLFLLQYMVVLAEEENEAAGESQEKGLAPSEEPSDVMSMLTKKLTTWCEGYMGKDSSICKDSKQYITPIFLFLVSTVFSIVSGIFYRFCFCIRRSRRRRKRQKKIDEMEEEEEYQRELLEHQMHNMRMQQMLQMGQSLPFMGTLQGIPTQSKGKKNKKSKKKKENSMNNALQLGYQVVA
ncbi:hypothetical protein, conserved [Plasmodium vivax]|uniref:Uncharacterized protein n=1 Tax=Plasmodium vivax TaxID=5855 RepID=A0A1G4GX05_PLAVI|nr:hypothetical protein, conserved [Plasmodium vivax]